MWWNYQWPAETLTIQVKSTVTYLKWPYLLLNRHKLVFVDAYLFALWPPMRWSACRFATLNMDTAFKGIITRVAVLKTWPIEMIHGWEFRSNLRQRPTVPDRSDHHHQGQAKCSGDQPVGDLSLKNCAELMFDINGRGRPTSDREVEVMQISSTLVAVLFVTVVASARFNYRNI